MLVDRPPALEVPEIADPVVELELFSTVQPPELEDDDALVLAAKDVVAGRRRNTAASPTTAFVIWSSPKTCDPSLGRNVSALRLFLLSPSSYAHSANPASKHDHFQFGTGGPSRTFSAREECMQPMRRTHSFRVHQLS
jgi:hypothetical protein